jgi:ABC-type antimicrobial peptide transport system permease subunit
MATSVTLNATTSGRPLVEKHESLWSDAMRRLARNRAAVIGGAIILILALVAIFANYIAPYPYEKQVLSDQNRAPAWVIRLFPSMGDYTKVSDRYLLGADYVTCSAGSCMARGCRWPWR